MTSRILTEKKRSLTSERLISLPKEWVDICGMKNTLRIALTQSSKYGYFIAVMRDTSICSRCKQETMDYSIIDGNIVCKVCNNEVPDL